MIKLLVVDDELEICEFLETFFAERGFRVLVAHNGKEALRVIESEGPAIVLLDIKMPVMDGMTALKEIKKNGSSCRVVMISGIDDPETITEARRYGASEYLVKPVLLDRLEELVLGMAQDIGNNVTPGRLDA